MTTEEVPRYHGFPLDEVLADYELGCESRALDDRQIALQKQSQVFFQISGAGHEALLLGMARSLRPGYDWFFPYYRDQALMLGLGMRPHQVLLQAVGAATDPASGGRQMPCHWGDVGLNVVTQSSPTGSQCPPAVGCAEAGRYIARRPDLPGCTAYGDEITYVSLGEGATSEGEFWESLNSACTLHLPVLFVVADNGFAISVPSSEQAPGPISDLVRGFPGLHIFHVDGTDYVETRRKAAQATSMLRAGLGPVLFHATVTRPYSHSGADTQGKYRTEEELKAESERGPLKRWREGLLESGLVQEQDLVAIETRARETVAAAALEALNEPKPDPGTALHNIVSLPMVIEEPYPEESAGEPVALGGAINQVLHELMGADHRIRVFGEDVADAREAILAHMVGKGGVFGTTGGLQREFGQARCFNAPLAEANIIGRGIGQAVRGLRPAVEIQFFDYIWPAMQQIRSEAATIRWRSNGEFECPLVMRVPIGGYLTGGSIWHSQCGESIFAHIPGLLIAYPSRARDVVGLMRTSFEALDPVLFLEHKHLLRQKYTIDAYPPESYRIPFGRGDVRRTGRDLTIVTWGATVEKSLRAADQLVEMGVEAEIIDLRTISPWDRDLVAESVSRTNKLLVVHEDTVIAGFGGEIAARIGEDCFGDLDAPIRRVGALDCHVAYSPVLEQAILPQVDDIYAAALDLAKF